MKKKKLPSILKKKRKMKVNTTVSKAPYLFWLILWVFSTEEAQYQRSEAEFSFLEFTKK